MAVMKPGWETFDHIADIGIRGIGRSIEEAFSNGGLALFSLVVDDVNSIGQTCERRVACESFDLTGLFVAWINTLIAEWDLMSEVYSRFDIVIKDARLKGVVWGEKWDRKKHGIGIEVKGGTFTEAKVFQENGLWIAQCVVDV